MDQVLTQQTMTQLPGQQQPLSMQPQLQTVPDLMAPVVGGVGGGVRRQESGPPLITFD